ncbi:MAG: indole-3-glycerol phosphate synthase TrpC [Candidatus Zixiibacteriota bacterium]
MKNILFKIAAHKKLEVMRLKQECSMKEVMSRMSDSEVLDFRGALIDKNSVNIIAEIKKASPSKGEMIKDFDPADLATKYKNGGAAALSVLTDEKYFKGSFQNIETAKKAANLPVLCKEFIVDEYQIYYARMMKADAVLLIVTLLNQITLKHFILKTASAGMKAIVEVHDEDETKRAVDAGADLIGVNNRNLENFSVSLEICEKLAALIPAGVLKVAESGIFNIGHINRLKKSGYHNFLIGEALVTAADPVKLLQTLRAA